MRRNVPSYSATFRDCRCQSHLPSRQLGIEHLAGALGAAHRQTGRIEQADLHQHARLVPVDVLVRNFPALEADDNGDGFWERGDIVALNDDILAALGGSALAPPALEPGWAEAPVLDPLRYRAAALLGRWVCGHPVVGWKDPRTSLTLRERQCFACVWKMSTPSLSLQWLRPTSGKSVWTLAAGPLMLCRRIA